MRAGPIPSLVRTSLTSGGAFIVEIMGAEIDKRPRVRLDHSRIRVSHALHCAAVLDGYDERDHGHEHRAYAERDVEPAVTRVTGMMMWRFR